MIRRVKQPGPLSIELHDEYVLSEVHNQSLKGKQVFFQGSRQMTNLSRRYYERELGAIYAPSVSLKEGFGYSEPFRRFIQRESFEPQANEIPNTMPSWLPGDDYMTNFKVGDPYVRIDDGYARLPGAGYEALHPELKGAAPEDYPDIHKLRILSDVAPYSRKYNLYRQKISSQAKGDTGLKIELDKIIDRVRQVKESSIRMDSRRFTAPVDEIEGTIESATPAGVSLKEYPGRVFRFSSVGTSAADISARILGENNQAFPSCRTTKPLARPRGRIAPSIVKSIKRSTEVVQKATQEAEHQAELREQQWEAQQERWRREEDQRQIAKSISESREQLNQVIQAWAKVVSIEQFFKRVEERASNLS
jgi:hypothetical protein